MFVGHMAVGRQKVYVSPDRNLLQSCEKHLKKQRVLSTTRYFTVNIIVFATSSGNVAGNHFISVCEGVPFLRNPKCFFSRKTREHVIGIGSETNVCEKNRCFCTPICV